MPAIASVKPMKLAAPAPTAGGPGCTAGSIGGSVGSPSTATPFAVPSRMVAINGYVSFPRKCLRFWKTTGGKPCLYNAALLTTFRNTASCAATAYGHQSGRRG